MKVKSESEVAQSCPTLATPWTAAYQAPPSMEFSRQKYWSGVPVVLSNLLGRILDMLDIRDAIPLSNKQMLKYVDCCYSVAQLCLVFATPRTTACQASLSFTISQNLHKYMSIDLMIILPNLMFQRHSLLK